MKSMTIAAQHGSIHVLEADIPATTPEPNLLPVVFVHGMACSADIWNAQLAYASDHRIN